MSMNARRSLFALALFVLTLGGCATSRPYGNFVAPALALDAQPLAAEAAGQLATLWPPARTRFALEHPTPDAFGTALVGALRTAGYAVLEHGPAQASGADSSAHGQAPREPGRVATEMAAAMEAEVANEADTVAKGEGQVPGTAALPLRYILDHDADTGLYRLTLWVGTQSLTRPYRAQDRQLVAAGYWVRRQ